MTYYDSDQRVELNQTTIIIGIDSSKHYQPM